MSVETFKPFDEVWEFADKIPGSFTRLSGEQLYKYALEVPTHYGRMVEVGVDQGRSASILLHALSLSSYLILVDKWESILIDNMFKVAALVDEFPMLALNVRIEQGASTEIAKLCRRPINLIHIDAHHHDDIQDGGPSRDCEAWLPKLAPGGIACFHDYNSTFPDVNKAVDSYCAGWEDLGVWDGLAIRRKPLLTTEAGSAAPSRIEQS